MGIEGANQRLTLAGGVSRLGVEPFGAGDAVADAVAHVAAGRGLEAVDDEAGAVAHAQRQLGDAALPVARDAARGVDRPGRHGGDLACCGREREHFVYQAELEHLFRTNRSVACPSFCRDLPRLRELARPGHIFEIN